MFGIVVFASNDYSWEGISSSLKAKRGWVDSSSIDANAYLWKIAKLFFQCASVYLIPLSVLVYKSVLKGSLSTGTTIKSAQAASQFKSTKQFDYRSQTNYEFKLKTWDVLISHASEDKEDFVRPLANALKSRGLNVWYDEFTLKVGDSLRRSIDRGLANSRYGIVVISPNFLRKEWPQKELDGLLSFEVNERRSILPIWHNIDLNGVKKFSPILADRVAVSSSIGISKVAEAITDAMRGN